MSVAFCAACGASLSAGARFCHRCGQPVGEAVVSPAAGLAGAPVAAARPQPQVLPWAVAAIALLALVALVAGKNFNFATSKAEPAVAATPAGAGAPAAGPFAGAPTGPNGEERPARAPDISQMSPAERANRLYNRLILLAEQGKTDSVQFFAPMAAMAFASLPELGPLERFELGRIGELSGSAQLAAAQADTILERDRNHLLGLALAATAARMKQDAARAKQFDARLLAAVEGERARNLPEYQVARVDIDSALARAKRGN